MLRLRDWLKDSFSVELERGTLLDEVYFKLNGNVPSCVYKCLTNDSWSEVERLLLAHCDWKPGSFETCQVILTFYQLLKKAHLWEKLYYIIGIDFFLFFFLECNIYFKWGNSFIFISTFQTKLYPAKKKYLPLKIPTCFDILERGFDESIALKAYRMLYKPIFIENSATLISERTPSELAACILNQNVGEELSYFPKVLKKRDIKVIKQFLLYNPTIKQCQHILQSIVDKGENIVPVEKIVKFVIEVMKRHIPKNVFYLKKRFKKFLQNIEHLLKFNLKQQVTLRFLLKGLIIKKDLLKENVIARFALWIYEVFVVKLIRCFFYVSEVDKVSSLMFFKKQFWLDFQSSTLTEMIKNKQLVEIKTVNEDFLKDMRFILKLESSGFRPVIKNSAYDLKQTCHLNLCNIYLKQLISTKYKRFPQPSSDIYRLWNTCSKDKKKKSNYFVKTDIKDAFGSIIHGKLKYILESLWMDTEEQLHLADFMFKGKWGDIETLQQFTNLKPATQKILTYKPGYDRILQATELKSSIFDYIDHIYVAPQFTRKRYHLIKGLHQGGKLSAVLCETYYSALDDEYFSRFSLNEGEILLRAIDDYLFISQNEDQVKTFLEIILNGFDDYGVQVQPDKTLSNFKNSHLNPKQIKKTLVIPYFGYSLNIENWSIAINMKKYRDIPISSTICFKKLDLSVLEMKMSSIISLNLNKLLFEPKYQTKKVIFRNIHAASCILALKFTAIIDFLSIAEVNVDESYMIFCIMKGVNNIAATCANKGKPVIKFSWAKKLCLKSFSSILKSKKLFYGVTRKLQKIEQRIKISSTKTSKIIKSTGKIFHPLDTI